MGLLPNPVCSLTKKNNVGTSVSAQILSPNPLKDAEIPAFSYFMVSKINGNMTLWGQTPEREVTAVLWRPRGLCKSCGNHVASLFTEEFWV